MNCYATLFVTWVAAGNGHLEYLLEKRLKPEVGLQHGGFDFPPARHKETAAVIRDHGLTSAVHLPFYGIHPGAADRETRRRGRDRLLKAVEIAGWYEPDHLIGHPEFSSPEDSLAADSRAAPDGGLDDSEQRPNDDWLNRSYQAWNEVLANSPALLYLENTADQSPAAIQALLAELPARASMCFDLGHWFYAAEGRERRNLGPWLDRIAGRVAHLHLHDNDGRSDQHLGIGQAEIDYPGFLEEMARRDLTLTVTLEAHNTRELGHSLAWLEALPDRERYFAI
jgi:sugar phosphate isomerase/epimerase